MDFSLWKPGKRWRHSDRRVVRDDIPSTVNENGLIPVMEFYSAREVSFMFGVTWCTMQKWLRRRLIPSTRTVGYIFQERSYRIYHRALMKFVSEHPEYEYVLDKLQGDLDMYEPVTLEQKNQEILRAIARSPRAPEPKHDSIHQDRTPPKEKRERGIRKRKAADKRFAENYQESDWPW